MSRKSEWDCYGAALVLVLSAWFVAALHQQKADNNKKSAHKCMYILCGSCHEFRRLARYMQEKNMWLIWSWLKHTPIKTMVGNSFKSDQSFGGIDEKHVFYVQSMTLCLKRFYKLELKKDEKDVVSDRESIDREWRRTWFLNVSCQDLTPNIPHNNQTHNGCLKRTFEPMMSNTARKKNFSVISSY